MLALSAQLSYFIDSMKIKQKGLIVLAGMGIALGMLASSSAVLAAECGGAQTSIISCDQGAGTGTTDNGVWYLLILTLNIMTAGVGILAVGGIAYGAALYASSGDKPEQAKQGKDFIKNVVIGLVAYGLMYTLLNFLIPGGIFSTSPAAGTGTSQPAPTPSPTPGNPVPQ